MVVGAVDLSLDFIQILVLYLVLWGKHFILHGPGFLTIHKGAERTS